MGFWYVLAFKVASFLPVWVDRLLASAVAFDFFVFNRSQRRGVFANLRVICPSADHRRTARLSQATFQQAGRNLIDFFRIPSLTNADITVMTSNFAQMPDLLDARTQGKEFCLVTGHYGNWELAGAVLGAHGYRTHAIALSHNSPAVEHLYDTLHERFHVTAHDVRFGMRQLLRGLPPGDVPAIVSDRAYGTGGEAVQFFGRTVSFPRGAALLCYRRKLIGVPGFLVRQRDGCFRAEFGTPIDPASTDERTWIHEFVQSFAEQYEAVVRRDPTQFLNFYDFWDGHP